TTPPRTNRITPSLYERSEVLDAGPDDILQTRRTAGNDGRGGGKAGDPTQHLQGLRSRRGPDEDPAPLGIDPVFRARRRQRLTDIPDELFHEPPPRPLRLRGQLRREPQEYEGVE